MKNNWQFAPSPAAWLLVAIVVMAIGFGCSSHTTFQKPPPRRVMNDTGPCPHYFSLLFEKLYPDAQVTALIGSQLDVPEYNDCQRLLVSNSVAPNPSYTNLQFGDVAAVFARAKLNNVYQMENPIGNAKTQPFYDALVRPRPTTTRVTSIGLVWTTGPYPRLGLPAGFACIVLQWEGPVGATPVSAGTFSASNSRNYNAWIVPVSYQQSCYEPLLLPASSAHRLGVLELPTYQKKTGPDDIPPVSRWDWDARRGEQYIGIACPLGWCELFRDDRDEKLAHLSSPTYHLSSLLGIPDEFGQVIRQKGWYDEEYLASARMKLGQKPELDPSGAFGTVFPVPRLGERSLTYYKVGTFVPVAWVSISPFSPEYSAKYGFKLNPAPPQRPNVNVLSLCRDHGSNECHAQPKNPCLPTSDHPGGPQFYARLGASVDDPEATDFCVDYIATDPSAHPPGTVRWRWLEDDPTVWVSCPSGCCQISKPK